MWQIYLTKKARIRLSLEMLILSREPEPLELPIELLGAELTTHICFFFKFN